VLVERERERPIALEDELLHQHAGCVRDLQRQRAGPDFDRERPDPPPHRPRDLTQRERRGLFAPVDNGRIDRQRATDADRLQRDAQASFTGDTHLELCRLAGRGDGLRLDACRGEGGRKQDDEGRKRPDS
jgi:hypothetical protein